MLHDLQAMSLFWVVLDNGYFVNFMNVYAKLMIFEIELNLWNEMSKLGHLVCEIAKLCAIYIYIYIYIYISSMLYGNHLYEIRLWFSLE